MNQKELKYIREEYPVGTRVKLEIMDDIQAPPIGTLGTVRLVDDIGSIHVNWDFGGGLAIVYGIDKCSKV